MQMYLIWHNLLNTRRTGVDSEIIVCHTFSFWVSFWRRCSTPNWLASAHTTHPFWYKSRRHKYKHTHRSPDCIRLIRNKQQQKNTTNSGACVPRHSSHPNWAGKIYSGNYPRRPLEFELYVCVPPQTSGRATDGKGCGVGSGDAGQSVANTALWAKLYLTRCLSWRKFNLLHTTRQDPPVRRLWPIKTIYSF